MNDAQEHQGGFAAPNTVQVPVALFEILPEITSLGEIKVLLAIIVQEFGYHSGERAISLSELQMRTGLTRQGVVNGITAGAESGRLTREKQGDSYSYRLSVVSELGSQRNRLATTTIGVEAPKALNIYRLWEQEARVVITPTTKDSIDMWVEEHGEEWAADAIREAAKTVGPGRFGPNYVTRILERWKREGRDAPKPSPTEDTRIWTEFQ